MEQQQWSEWIEWKGGECPIPGVKCPNYQLKYADGSRYDGAGMAAADFWSGWVHGRTPPYLTVVAYRVRLTAQQPTEPATTESDRDIGDGVDENAAMLARDSAGMVKAVEPQDFAARGRASFDELQRLIAALTQPKEAPGLLVLAPMERLGATRWGAE